MEEATGNKRGKVCSGLLRIVNIDNVPNQKHHRTVFIAAISSLNIFIHLLTHINVSWQGRPFRYALCYIFMFCIPCMRPASDTTRLLNVDCNSLESNKTCYYDDRLREMCSSFMYPYQLWRFFTASLFHMVWYHLVINVSKQALYGFLLERKYGTIRVSIIYWLSAFSSCLTFMLEHREARKCVGDCLFF